MAVTKELEDVRLNLSSGHGKSDKNKKSRPSSSHTTSARKGSPGCSQPTESLQVYQSLVTKERWKEIKKMTEVAIKDRKVFLIRGGGFPAIRKALLSRGWIQKFDPPKSSLQNSCYLSKDSIVQDNGNELDKSNIKCEKLIMHKLLEEQPIDFLWTSKREGNDWLLVKSDVIVSKFCKANFTSKEGLCSSLNQMYWYNEPGVSNTHFPRCYNLQLQEQLDDFIDNFRLTACTGLLKWLVATYIAEGEEAIIKENSKIPLTAIDFAIRRLTEYIHFVTHKDIDSFEDKSSLVWEYEWDQFLTHHYLVIHENERFSRGKTLTLEDLHFKATKVLKSLRKHWPQMDIDGVMNIWIVKPANKCRGRGIQLMNNMKEIIGIVNITPTTKSRFVVQKYIESPLTIYDTKFDIRQWFLITCSQPLTIWIYKDSYLRFSSQLYNLNNYHESVHLTNNAVQCRYKNNDDRDKALPDENMWDCHSFKAYLRQIGSSGMWEDRIYPGMKECLIGAMLACQDSLEKRANSFELYGADFMLTEDFTPWLIEINSSPDLAPTTSITARMCPQCLEDVIKVVIDTRTDPDADTGLFELAYKQIIPKGPAYLGLTLSISGKKLVTKKKNEKEKTKNERDAAPASKPDSIERVESHSGSVMRELMSWLHPCTSEIITVKKEPDVISATQDDLKTVQDTLKIVKSGLLLKASKAKRKLKSNAKKDRSNKTKSPLYCCKLENGTIVINQETRKPTRNNVTKSYWQDPKEVKSVGNKRCYIEPTTWEKDTASILRSCLTSNVQLSENKSDKHFQQITPRIFSPGITSSSHTCSRLKRYSQKNGPDNELRGSMSLKVVRLKQHRRNSSKKENLNAC